MKTLSLRCVAAAAVVAAVAALSACSITAPKTEAVVRYDFGLPAAALEPTRALPPITLLDVQAGPGLDTPALHYRLLYADSQQSLPYAQSRWSVAPGRLVETRLRQKLGRIATVLETGDTALAPVLRVNVEELTHVFDRPGNSRGLVRLTATVLVNRKVVGSTAIERSAPAPSHDAVGGVRALTAATDAALDQLAQWLQALPADRLVAVPVDRAVR
jgi:cholesterol transport system auxiliary component